MKLLYFSSNDKLHTGSMDFDVLVASLYHIAAEFIRQLQYDRAKIQKDIELLRNETKQLNQDIR